MMKRPSFQFYPADWRKDAALQSCSLAAQGLWINCMCIAHECTPYGFLTVNGKAMSPAQIGRLVGLSEKESIKLLQELDDSGVCSRTDDGAYFSRRMVADEELRNRRASGGEAGKEFGKLGADHGKKGGRPRKETGVKKPPLEPPPSSSSSSSSSTSIKDTHIGGQSESVGDIEPPQRVSIAGAVCVALRAEGIASVNPGNVDLLALLDAGADVANFVAAGRIARERGKGFSYVLGVVKGQMADAKRMAAGAVAQATPVRQLESFAERDRRHARERWEQMTGRRHPDSDRPAPGASGIVIDAEPALQQKRIGGGATQ